MTQLTKKNLKELMLTIINNQDDGWSEDSWLSTDKDRAIVGLQLLAKELNIDLELGAEYND